jgi:hypothetical protein
MLKLIGFVVVGEVLSSYFFSSARQRKMGSAACGHDDKAVPDVNIHPTPISVKRLESQLLGDVDAESISNRKTPAMPPNLSRSHTSAQPKLKLHTRMQTEAEGDILERVQLMRASLYAQTDKGRFKLRHDLKGLMDYFKTENCSTVEQAIAALIKTDMKVRKAGTKKDGVKSKKEKEKEGRASI